MFRGFWDLRAFCNHECPVIVLTFEVRVRVRNPNVFIVDTIALSFTLSLAWSFSQYILASMHGP